MKNVNFILLSALFIIWGQIGQAQIVPKIPLDPPYTVDSSTWKCDGGPVYLKTTSKKVGIGTTDPVSKLHVAGDVFIPVYYSYSIGSATDANNRLRLRHLSGNACIDYSPNLYFRAGTTPFVSFTSSKRVGIGTTSPDSKLQINGEGNPFYIESQSSATGDTMHSLQLWGSDQVMYMGVSTKHRVSYIQSADTWTASNTLALNARGGSVAIGTTDAKGYRFAVAGNMIAEQIFCKLQQNWPDFVFNDNYNLKPLPTVEQYIKAHNHLPDVPAATEVEEAGIDLGQMNAILLQKIEELTLYLIEQNKKIEDLQKQVKQIQK
ncbi:MAG: hypothetical protein LBL18_03815 [Bacteroidales bacterium]|jgi:hypothetical protein|nr:hypothetical protein [Bacteroidales bacterium]